MKRAMRLGCLLCLVVAVSHAEENGPYTSSGRWVLQIDKPEGGANNWMIGNGGLGASISATPGRESLMVVHEKCWDVKRDRRCRPEIKGGRGIFEGARRSVRGIMKVPGVRKAYNRLLTWSETDIQPGSGDPINHPAFSLQCNVQLEGGFSDYSRTLDLETGLATASYEDSQGHVRQEVFSSRADDVVCVRYSSESGRKLYVTLGISARVTKDRGTPVIEAGENSLYYFFDYVNDRSGYEGVVKVAQSGGTLGKEGDQLKVAGADEILILTRVNYHMISSDTIREETERALGKLLGRGFDELLSAHSHLHGGIFTRAMLDLGAAEAWKRPVSETLAGAAEKGPTPAFVEMMFAAGRYFLLSDSGDYPPALLGLWTTSWSPPWSGGFVYDSNVNLQTYLANMGNMRECMESYMGHVERLLPGWRLNAKNFFGSRGFLVAHYADPETGYLASYSNRWFWVMWPGGGGWNIRPFYDYYLTYGDDEFLRNRLVPIYKEQAQFYEDYVYKNENGKYDIVPGVSPENAPSKPPARWMPVTYNTTFDLGVARETLKIIIDACNYLGIEQENVRKWQEIRDNLYEYRINEDGALAEWAPENLHDRYPHRHNSHLYCAFPSLEFSMDDTPAALVQAARIAVDKRQEHSNCFGHGLVESGLISARLKHKKGINHVMNQLAKENYFFASMASRHHQGQMIFDVSGAVPMILMEMLCYTRPGVIELMPCWPESMPQEGSIKGLMTRCGAQLDMSWKDGKPVKAVLVPTRDGKCQVRLDGRKLDLEMKNGKREDVTRFLKTTAKGQ